MDTGRLLDSFGFLWSPLTFAALVGLAVGLIWLAFAPAAPRRECRSGWTATWSAGMRSWTDELQPAVRPRADCAALRGLLDFARPAAAASATPR